jgi:hypothetical protein
MGRRSRYTGSNDKRAEEKGRRPGARLTSKLYAQRRKKAGSQSSLTIVVTLILGASFPFWTLYYAARCAESQDGHSRCLLTLSKPECLSPKTVHLAHIIPSI